MKVQKHPSSCHWTPAFKGQGFQLGILGLSILMGSLHWSLPFQMQQEFLITLWSVTSGDLRTQIKSFSKAN